MLKIIIVKVDLKAIEVMLQSPGNHIFNHILGRERQSNNSYINVNSVPCCDPAADAFNDHFINVVDNVSNVEDCLNDFRNYLNPSPMYSMYLFSCNVLGIKKYINSLKSISAEHDDITAALLKQTLDHISISLTHGTFPCKLKIAELLPLYNSGCKSDINNYRQYPSFLLLAKY